MRSLYVRILLWSFGSLALAMIGLVFLSRLVLSDMFGPGTFFERSNNLQLEEAREAYESGGAEGLSIHLKRINSKLGGDRYLTTTDGIDLVTGENRAAITAQLPPGDLPRQIDGRVGFSVLSPDNRYRLFIFGDVPFEMRRYLFAYYVPVLLALALWSWILGSRIVTPLRELMQAVDRLGRGDFSSRVSSRRRDEIGKLGAAFDRMAERIESLLTAERRLLQDVSHELRTPLARLSFAIELLPSDSEWDSAVGKIRKEAQRLNDLVDALLKATQAEGDLAGLMSESVSPGAIVRDVVSDCQLDAEARRCGIAVDGRLDVAIEGNPELLRRAIENIVRNAIRYTPEGSAINVVMKSTNGVALISVRDYGPGVPEADLPRIFLPFFRVDDSRNSATGGAGLGLTIAQRAVSSHHGRIVAENMEPGLRVTIELPISK